MTASSSDWKPVAYQAGPELAGLVSSGNVLVHDAIDLQLADLMQLRSPARKLGEEELRPRVEAHLGGTPREAYGTWFHYPWSRTLVHVLPPAEFRELRSGVNRHKITAAEQERLARFVIGVVGLSVGQSTAVTLALEGIGGELRLADFDHLTLANMNRLRASVQGLGVNKAVLTARTIFEFDPYANVTIFTEGVTDGNIEAFLDGLDLVFEECDDLRMKVRLRERARARRIAVVMGTSDRGLLDVERFDREPDRPLFHGMTGALDGEKLDGLTAVEKLPIAFAIVGRTLSKRVAVSFLDVGTTIGTWPQLASAVALNSAINADAARRILLGQFTESGRFFVDLEELVRDGAGAETPRPAPQEESCPPPASDPVPDLVPTPHSARGERFSIDEVRTLLAHGTLAPSGGNCQPWRFVVRGGRILCLHDEERSRSGSMLDVEHAATHLAFGALGRNIELAARALGRPVTVVPFPEPGIVCSVEPLPSTETPRSELADFIAERATNRRIAPYAPLERSHRAALIEAAQRAGATLQLATDEDVRVALGHVLGQGDRLRYLSPAMHREMVGEIRWTREDALTRRDGLDLATLELGPGDRVGLHLVADGDVMKMARALGAGRGLELPARKALLASSAVGLLSIAGTDPRAYFAGGRAMQDVWLTATAHRLAIQPMTALLYMFARLERGGGAGFSREEQAELSTLRHRFRELFEVRMDHADLMLFRISYANPPSARSLRRRLGDVIAVEP
ncbi:Rv1355c family protein [Pendulispora rubella]|uniref:Rv1355c family protein n=1 Tax=Pendulispora rubella TaxID=2741070 RepID=A0ABZ2LKM8_9BACT